MILHISLVPSMKVFLQPAFRFILRLSIVILLLSIRFILSLLLLLLLWLLLLFFHCYDYLYQRYRAIAAQISAHPKHLA